MIGIVIISTVLFTRRNQNQAGALLPPSQTATSSTPASSGSPVVSPVVSPVSPAPAPSPSTSAVSYTLVEVAAHATRSNCWTAINGGVYNVTSWITQHPGGAEAIIGLCGKDGSEAYNAQHGGARRPASELASFKIGALKQ